MVFTKEQMVYNFKRVREEIEAERTMSFEAEALLYDLCAAAGFSEAEAQHVMGPSFLMVQETLRTNGVETEGYFCD